MIAVKKALEPFGLTYNIYMALMEILRGHISIDGLEQPTQAPNMSPASKRPLNFKYVAVLPVLFELLVNADLELKDKVVRDLTAVLQVSLFLKYVFGSAKLTKKFSAVFE